MKTLKRFSTRMKVWLTLLATITCLAGMGYGVFRLFAYSLPMQMESFYEASQSDAGDKGVALYDAALQEFKAERYDSAQQLLVMAYSALTEQKESQSNSDEKMAARVQFLLGVVNEKTKKTQPAIEAYKMALRHNPDHMEAKYNLERLMVSGGGKGQGSGPGKDDGNGPPSSGQGSQGKKGI